MENWRRNLFLAQHHARIHTIRKKSIKDFLPFELEPTLRSIYVKPGWLTFDNMLFTFDENDVYEPYEVQEIKNYEF